MSSTNPGRRAIDAGSALTVLLVLSLLIPAAVLAGAGYSGYQATLAEQRRTLDRSVDVLQEHSIKVFETHALVAAQVDEILRGLSDEAIAAREGELRARIQAAVRDLPQIQDLWVIGGGGRALVSTNIYPVPRETDFSDRDYFAAHVLNPKLELFIGDVLRGRVDPTRIFFQVSRRRAAPDGSFNGVIAVSVEPGYFRRVFERFVAPQEGAFAALVRADGARLARTPDPQPGPFRIPSGSTFTRAIAENPVAGNYETVSSTTGVDSIVAYRRHPTLPVYAAIALPRSAVWAAWWDGGFGRQLLFGVPATLALFGVTLLALRRTRAEQAALRRARQEARRRKTAEAQLLQAQKMEAIGQLTGGVAHDFNNLLTIIVGGLDAILRRPEQPDRVKRFADAALAAAWRGERLTQQLLAFGRRQTLRPQAVDLGALTTEIKALLRRAVGEAIKLEFERAAGLAATVDPAQFEAALLNLVVNARDATPPGGRITVGFRSLTLREGEVPELKAGDYVRVQVSDTGSGMTPEVQGRVFEPFFTTKEVGKGSGLGLSQVYGFARQSGGTVTIESVPGAGTTVSFYLPRAAEAATAAQAGPSVMPPVSGGATVLVVEDDADVRAMVMEALRDRGYHVLAAENGPTALALLEGGASADLLFTDVVMPKGVSGPELAARARVLRPSIKILLTSGYAAQALDERDPLLRKPYKAEDLVAAVELALGRSRAAA